MPLLLKPSCARLFILLYPPPPPQLKELKCREFPDDPSPFLIKVGSELSSTSLLPLHCLVPSLGSRFPDQEALFRSSLYWFPGILPAVGNDKLALPLHSPFSHLPCQIRGQGKKESSHCFPVVIPPFCRPASLFGETASLQLRVLLAMAKAHSSHHSSLRILSRVFSPVWEIVL